MDQNQTPVPQPDYNFIVNQPGPNGELPGMPPKKRNTKVIVLVVLVAVTIVAVLVALLLPASNKQKEGINENSTSKEVVQTYLNEVEDLDFDAAYALLNPQTRVSKQMFVDIMAPALLLTVFLDRCTVQDPQGDTVQAKCTESDTSTVSTVTFKMSDGKPPAIDYYGLTEVTE